MSAREAESFADASVECLDPVEELPVAFNEAQVFAGVQIVWVLESFKPTVSEVVNLVA